MDRKCSPRIAGAGSKEAEEEGRTSVNNNTTIIISRK
jgi:hypothetical protein